jgi:hypothetical protein
MRTATTIRSDRRLRAEWNYNRFAGLGDKTGDVIMYKSPSDSAEHPLYVDAEGRMVPVDPVSLLPMYNGSGHVVDKNGVTVPKYVRTNGAVHIDDVRIAVVVGEISVKDENGNDILLSKNGKIVPTDTDGSPYVTTYEGAPHVKDEAGNIIAKLSEVFAVSDVRPPASADNLPLNDSYQYVPETEEVPHHDDPTIFPIDSIVDADRPSRRGIKAAFVEDAPSIPEQNYRHGRHYIMDAEVPYKYWRSGTESTFTPSVSGANIVSNGTFTNGTGWTAQSMTVTYTGIATVTVPGSFGRMWTPITVQPDTTYRVSADIGTNRPGGQVEFYVRENGVMKQIYKDWAMSGQVVTFDFGFTTSGVANTMDLFVYFRNSQPGFAHQFTLDNLTVRQQEYDIVGVGPRALYDRPVNANKIDILIDTTMGYAFSEDENGNGFVEAQINKPIDYEVRVERDRGDGLGEWVTIATNPTINEAGRITLEYRGGTWADANQTPGFPDGMTKIRGVQLIVRSVNHPGQHVDVVEISARLALDLTDYLIDTDYNFTIDEGSVVVPFGVVTSNTGSVRLSNHDGRFERNKYLKDIKGDFTTIENPLYGLTGRGIKFTFDLDTYQTTPGGFVRKYTMHSVDAEGGGTDVIFSLKDSSEILQRKMVPRTFFDDSTGITAVRAMYTICDLVGFTSLNVESVDERTLTSMKRYWTDGESTAWELIQKICEDTQMAAYFDEYDVLQFLDNRTIKRRALSEPAALLTEEDESGYANIEKLDKTGSIELNKVKINYKEAQEGEPDVLPTMDILWEPEGTVLLRSAALVDPITSALAPEKGGDQFIRLVWDSTRTWPWEGLVNIDGEIIKYKGKQYSYYTAAGTQATKWLENQDEQNALDKLNDKMAHKNAYTGRIKIVERGVEGTLPKPHPVDIEGYLFKSWDFGGTPGTFTATRINSCMRIAPVGGTDVNRSFVASRGNMEDYRPDYYGTRLKFDTTTYTHGRAGMAIGLAGNDTGIYIEMQTTDVCERAGRENNELRIYMKGNDGKHIWRGHGIPMPVEKNTWYDMEVWIGPTKVGSSNIYEHLSAVVLKVGNKGNNVRTLQIALNNKGEKVTVSGTFDTATEKALKRFQQKNGIAASGQTNPTTWQKLGTHINANVTSISVAVNGTYYTSIDVPNAELPQGAQGGRFGVYARGNTHVLFEHLYAIDGPEEVAPGSSKFYDRVRGGYSVNQFDLEWTYDIRHRWFWRGDQKVKKNVKYTNLYFDDFGPYAHEIREFNVKFDTEQPVRVSHLYSSNDTGTRCIFYNADSFGAKFVLANTARTDQVVAGEDTSTFGSENSVEQRLMIYGKPVSLSEERTITVTDERAVRRQGEVEFSFSPTWIQDKEQAQALASQVVEAIAGSVDIYSAELFPDTNVKLGDIVSVYAPKRGLDKQNGNYARFIVTGIDESFNGTIDRRVKLRQVINLGDYSFKRMSEILSNNNNNMLYNPYFLELHPTGIAKGWQPSSAIMIEPAADPKTWGITLRGYSSAGVTGRLSSIRPNKYSTVNPEGVAGNFAPTSGHYYLFTADVYARTNSAVELALEGFTTGGSYINTVASEKVAFNMGERKRIVLFGQFTGGGLPDEVRPVIRLLTADGKYQGTIMNVVNVHDAFYRQSDDPTAVYPTTGFNTLARP